MAKTLPLPCVPHCLCCHLAFAFVLPPAFGGLNHLPLPRGPLRTYTKTAIEWMAGHLLECALPDGAGVRGPNLQFGTPRCCSHPLNGVPRIQLWTPDDASPRNPLCLHDISLGSACHLFGPWSMSSLWQNCCLHDISLGSAGVRGSAAGLSSGGAARERCRRRRLPRCGRAGGPGLCLVAAKRARGESAAGGGERPTISHRCHGVRGSVLSGAGDS